MTAGQTCAGRRASARPGRVNMRGRWFTDGIAAAPSDRARVRARRGDRARTRPAAAVTGRVRTGRIPNGVPCQTAILAGAVLAGTPLLLSTGPPAEPRP